MTLTTNLLREVSATDSQSDYVAVELLWNALVKAAHSKNSPKEFTRLQLLVADLHPAQVAALIQHPTHSPTLVTHGVRDSKNDQRWPDRR